MPTRMDALSPPDDPVLTRDYEDSGELERESFEEALATIEGMSPEEVADRLAILRAERDYCTAWALTGQRRFFTDPGFVLMP